MKDFYYFVRALGIIVGIFVTLYFFVTGTTPLPTQNSSQPAKPYEVRVDQAPIDSHERTVEKTKPIVIQRQY